MTVNTLLLLIIPLGFVILFGGLWFGITTLLGKISGWGRLETYYPDRDDPPLLILKGQSGMMGQLRMSGVLTLEACRSGLRISIMRLLGPFQKPLFVPWDQINPMPARLLLMSTMRLGFGHPEQGALTIHERSWQLLISQPR